MSVAGLPRPIAFPDKARGRTSSAEVYPWLAGMAVAAGIAGQLGDRSAPSHGSWRVHAFFGLLLCCAIAARFLHEMRRTPALPVNGIRALDHRLKRSVFLLLYGLAGLKETVNITVYLRHGGAFAVPGFQSGHTEDHAAGLPSLDDFQIYLLYGVLAIILIRILSTIWRSRRGPRGMDDLHGQRNAPFSR